MSSKEHKTPDEQVLDQQTGTNEEHPEVDTTVEASDTTDSRDERIAELEAQVAELQQRERDSVLRSRAEIENIRRRTDIDIEKAHKFGLEKFSTAILPVIDNLERALESADKSNSDLAPMIEGVELTLKSFIDVARKFGIDVVGETNVPFNPEVHEAMTMIPSDQHEPNHVMMVMQKGYTLNGRLIRPAMVAVSKA